MKRWFPTMILGVLLGMIMMRGGFAVLGPLFRFMLLFLMGYFLFRMVTGVLFFRKTIGAAMKSGGMHNTYGGSATGANATGTTIDMCPICGEELTKTHHCR